MRQSLDAAVEERLGPGITRRDFEAIGMAVETLRKERGWDWVRPQGDVQTKYRNLILTPQEVRQKSLEDLYVLPPLIVTGHNDEYATAVPVQTFDGRRLKKLRHLNE